MLSTFTSGKLYHVLMENDVESMLTHQDVVLPLPEVLFEIPENSLKEEHFSPNLFQRVHGEGSS